MRRRTFLQSTLAAGFANSLLAPLPLRGLGLARSHGTSQHPDPSPMTTRSSSGAIPRREYRDGVRISIVGFGGIVLVGHEQKEANEIVARAVDRGVNYFDVAPSYGKGEAEEKLGPALEPHRSGVFLACKTQERAASGALRELEQSLRRLRTGHLDLYQLHAVTSTDDVKQILGKGGALETFVKAKKEGKVRYLGFSAHSEEAALALMDAFPFDSVLFPVNFVCMSQGNFGPRVLKKAEEKGVARLALKAMAYTPWPKSTDRAAAPKCWYKPVEDLALAQEALRFTLSQNISAAIPPGDERYYQAALDAAAAFTPLSEEEQANLLARAQGLTPLFHS